jgi:protein TonB
MLRTLHPLLAEPRTGARRRTAAIAVVAGLHVVLGAALVSGMAARVVQQIPTVLNAEVIVEPQRTVEVPPPPLAPKDFLKPSLPTVPEPVIRIARAPVPHSAITVVRGPVAPVAPAVTAAPEPVAAVAAPVLPAAPTAPSAVAGTHTIPPYPDLARRLGEEGMVVLDVALDADGRVTDVRVNRSSGSARLDGAAVAWVRDNWRYRPATRDGAGVAATVQAGVVFNLKHAG